MGNNSVPKFIFRLSRFPVYRGSVLGRFYCTLVRQPSMSDGKLITDLTASPHYCTFQFAELRLTKLYLEGTQSNDMTVN